MKSKFIIVSMFCIPEVERGFSRSGSDKNEKSNFKVPLLIWRKMVLKFLKAKENVYLLLMPYTES